MQMIMINELLLARVTWFDPISETDQELALAEGATASIGRLETNDICIREQHVSRQHAVINFRDGVFLINDLGSANGVYVNDLRVTEPYPLVNGDQIKLYVPIINFFAIADEEASRHTSFHSKILPSSTGHGKLIVTTGVQEGSTIPLLGKKLSVGRATSKAEVDIALQDPSVSRQHARLELVETSWVLYDLGSANGTQVNGTPVNEKGRNLRDGDVIAFGSTVTLFREN
jgi:pSer/pThr/pTyr-binding forkhead associated (FHA) protein